MQGIHTALVTPFDDADRVDLAAFERLCERQVAGGVDGLVPCGTTGETPTLSVEEQDALVRAAVSERMEATTSAGLPSTSLRSWATTDCPKLTLSTRTSPFMKLAMHWSVKTRATVASALSSASLNCVFWKSPMVLPKALRPAVYSTVQSITVSATVAERMACARRSCASLVIISSKPLPSSPSMADAGTRRSSKNSSEVSCAFMPTLCRFFPRRKPGRLVSTRNSVTPLAPAALSVLVASTMTSHSWPLEMKTFCPLMT